jgi:hypothetical protein
MKNLNEAPMELLRLLARARMAMNEIPKTHANIAKAMPPLEEIADDPDKMIQIMDNSLDLLVNAARDYHEAISDVQKFVTETVVTMQDRVSKNPDGWDGEVH